MLLSSFSFHKYIFTISSVGEGECLCTFPVLTSGYNLVLSFSWVLTKPQNLTLDDALNTSRKPKISGQLVES